jgi:hypothetical protein
MRALALGALAVTTAGCMAAVRVMDPSLSDAETQKLQEETAPYLQKGSGSISGVVTVDTGQRQITAPANSEVFLTPATSFANERLQKYVIERNELPEKRESQLVLMGRTDSQGRFRFQALAAGDYIVASDFAWIPPGSSEPRIDVAYARVHLGAGESTTVTVTRRVTGS